MLDIGVFFVEPDQSFPIFLINEVNNVGKRIVDVFESV